MNLEWVEESNRSKIITLTNGDIKKGPSTWNPLFDWFIETAIKFKEMVKKFDI